MLTHIANRIFRPVCLRIQKKNQKFWWLRKSGGQASEKIELYGSGFDLAQANNEPTHNHTGECRGLMILAFSGQGDAPGCGKQNCDPGSVADWTVAGPVYDESGPGAPRSNPVPKISWIKKQEKMGVWATKNMVKANKPSIFFCVAQAWIWFHLFPTTGQFCGHPEYPLYNKWNTHNFNNPEYLSLHFANTFTVR